MKHSVSDLKRRVPKAKAVKLKACLVHSTPVLSSTVSAHNEQSATGLDYNYTIYRYRRSSLRRMYARRAQLRSRRSWLGAAGLLLLVYLQASTFIATISRL